MPFIIADGSAVNLPGVTYAQLKVILFEKVITGLPAGVTQKSSGGVIQWVEFAPPAIDAGSGPILVNPANVSQLFA